MAMTPLEHKLKDWFLNPAIQYHDWDPALFWKARDAHDPFGTLRVDAAELEVYFAAIIGAPSECYDAVNHSHNGENFSTLPRADFLTMTAHRNDLPLFTPASETLH